MVLRQFIDIFIFNNYKQYTMAFNVFLIRNNENGLRSPTVRIYLFSSIYSAYCIISMLMSCFPDSHSFLSPFSSVLEQSFCALRTLILILEISCSFCKTLLNIWILYTEILSNAFKTCYFPQIHSVKCCHPLFIIPGIVSIILYGPVALCLF